MLIVLLVVVAGVCALVFMGPPITSTDWVLYGGVFLLTAMMVGVAVWGFIDPEAFISSL